MNDVVERVAKAIHMLEEAEGLPWSCEYEGLKEKARCQARAAIATLKVKPRNCR
jgi:hypothetical protein